MVDIDKLTVVDTPYALHITKNGNSQKIKTIIKELKGRESDLYHIHFSVHCPWRMYTILDEGLSIR